MARKNVFLTRNSLLNLSIFLCDFISSIPTIKTTALKIESRILVRTSVVHPLDIPIKTKLKSNFRVIKCKFLVTYHDILSKL